MRENSVIRKPATSVLIRFAEICTLLLLAAGLLSAQQRVKIAIWGDSRENLDGACERIASILLHDITDWDFQIHNGDFSHDGSADAWERSLKYAGIDSIVKPGRFLMCTSNHDIGDITNRAVYDRYTSRFLPVNSYDSSTHFYDFRLRQVHVMVCDSYLTPPDVMQQWLRTMCSSVPDSEWIIGVWHTPAYPDISYKEGSLNVSRPWLDIIGAHGRGFIVNGHAHQYVRTKPLAPDGTPDDSLGLVHIVNGTGGASWAHALKPGPRVAFTPAEKSFPCITFLTFEGRTVTLETVDARPDSKLRVIDRWSWSR